MDGGSGYVYLCSSFVVSVVSSAVSSSSWSPMVDAAVLALLLLVRLLSPESESEGGECGASTPTRRGMGDVDEVEGIEEVVSWEGVGMVPWF